MLVFIDILSSFEDLPMESVLSICSLVSWNSLATFLQSPVVLAVKASRNRVAVESACQI
jgi:hypothetical protein